MNKIISYSLFGDPSSFEFGFYLRGLVLNSRMNKILLPDWMTVFNVSHNIYRQYEPFLKDLAVINNPGWGTMLVYEDGQKCANMLRRLQPAYLTDWATSHLLTRDADSVITYREANCIREWVQSGYKYHAINDNDAHGGLMGGLFGINPEQFKKDTGYDTWGKMIGSYDFSKHGSDQNFMNKFIQPRIKHSLLFHNLKGQGAEAAQTVHEAPSIYVDRKYKHADLISRYCGSAGVIDFETLRFCKSMNPSVEFDDFEKKYSDICYWA